MHTWEIINLSDRSDAKVKEKRELEMTRWKLQEITRVLSRDMMSLVLETLNISVISPGSITSNENHASYLSNNGFNSWN